MSFCIPIVSSIALLYVKFFNLIFGIFLPVDVMIVTLISFLAVSFIIFLIVKIFVKPYSIYPAAGYSMIYINALIYGLAFFCGIS
ncbi:MAG: hypothetical protein HYT70_00540 [Candidatus Aenigmarchaeota archaeon]|nr:hypothetical protein [Candidatus Aenigmarchaeota archaeon]